MARKSLQQYAVFVPLLASIFLFSGCIAQWGVFRDSDYQYLGQTETVLPTDWSNCQLDLRNSIGAVTIKMADDVADYLLHATVKVYGRGGEGSLEEANTIAYSPVTEDSVLVTFDDSASNLFNLYTYELDISVRKDISLALLAEVSTGHLDVSLADLTITALDLKTSTGRLDVDLSGVDVNAPTAKLDTSTGQLSVRLIDLTYTTAQTNWVISASTGQIHCTIEQTIPDTQGTRKFDVSASTGSITVDTTLSEENGIKIMADTSLGAISLPSGGETYTSPNYETASAQYVFDLETSTGKITFR